MNHHCKKQCFEFQNHFSFAAWNVNRISRHGELSMRLLLVLLAWSVLPAAAQFASLSTTQDGSVLFFTTPLSQTGTDQPNHGKVFIVDANGVQLLQSRNRDVFPNTSFVFPPSAYMTNFYDLVDVSAAGDLSQLAIAALRECSGYSSGHCFTSDRTDVYNARGENTLSVNGHLMVSRNGNWGLVTEDQLADIYTRFIVVDLVTSKTYSGFSEILGSRDWSQQGIADNGTAVIAAWDRLLIFRPPASVQTISNQGAATAAIDAQATTVVWRDATRGVLIAKLGLIPSPRVLDENGYDPRISADGALILFRAPAAVSGASQVYLIRSDGSGRRQVTQEPEGIESAVLSGSGEIAWVMTNTGRLLQLDLTSGLRREFIGPVPAVLDAPFTPGVQPGLLVTRAAAGQALTVPASVSAGDTIEAQMEELSAPLLRVENGLVTVQVPWEAELGRTYGIALYGRACSGWTGAGGKALVQQFQPRFLFSADGVYALAAHEGFDGVVTGNQPAHPGEIVHIYGVGFGPVSPAIATGVPAPVSPLSSTVAPLSCQVQNRDHPQAPAPATVMYAGLAPLTIGYYQLDLLLPAPLSAGTYAIFCNMPAEDQFLGVSGLLPVD
jgi:uncharacterized protein (TIGR03437 family)